MHKPLWVDFKGCFLRPHWADLESFTLGIQEDRGSFTMFRVRLSSLTRHTAQSRETFSCGKNKVFVKTELCRKQKEKLCKKEKLSTVNPDA